MNSCAYLGLVRFGPFYREFGVGLLVRCRYHHGRCVDLVGRVERILGNSPHVSKQWIVVQPFLGCKEHLRIYKVFIGHLPFLVVRQSIFSLDDLSPWCYYFSFFLPDHYLGLTLFSWTTHMYDKYFFNYPSIYRVRYGAITPFCRQPWSIQVGSCILQFEWFSEPCYLIVIDYHKLVLFTQITLLLP